MCFIFIWSIVYVSFELKISRKREIMRKIYSPIFCLMIHLRWISLLIFMGGCTNITIYKNPLSELSESATRTRIAIGAISHEANRAKVTALAIKAATESDRFGSTELTELVPLEYIKVRTDGVKLIERLAVRMLEVIDSEAGATAAKSIENVGKKAETLAGQLDNTTLARYAGPVSNLAGTVIRIYDQNKREEILQVGIKEGIPEAQKIIEILKEEFSPSSPTNTNEALLDELKMQVTERINLYNLLLKSELNLSEIKKKEQKRISGRMKSIQNIIDAQEAVDALNTLSLSQTLNSLSETLDKLKKVVISNQDPRDFSIFVAQLTDFSARSVELLDAVRTVQKARISDTE